MDIEDLTVRSETVSGINVSAMLLVEVKSPIVMIIIPERLKIVDVRALSMENLPEEALLCHIQAGEFKEVIHTVLKHHAMLPGTL